MELFFMSTGKSKTDASCAIFPAYEDVFHEVTDELKAKVDPLLAFDRAKIGAGSGRAFFLMHAIENEYLSYQMVDDKIAVVENLADLSNFEEGPPRSDYDGKWSGMDLYSTELGMSLADLIARGDDWEDVYIEQLEKVFYALEDSFHEKGNFLPLDRYSYFGGAAVPIQTGYLADIEDMENYIGQMDPASVGSYSQVLYLFDGGVQNGRQEFYQHMQMT